MSSIYQCDKCHKNISYDRVFNVIEFDINGNERKEWGDYHRECLPLQALNKLRPGASISIHFRELIKIRIR